MNNEQRQNDLIKLALEDLKELKKEVEDFKGKTIELYEKLKGVSHSVNCYIEVDYKRINALIKYNNEKQKYEVDEESLSVWDDENFEYILVNK